MPRCNDLGVGSRDAVVLSGELSELLGRPDLTGGVLAAPDDQCAGAVSRPGPEPESEAEAMVSVDDRGING